MRNLFFFVSTLLSLAAFWLYFDVSISCSEERLGACVLSSNGRDFLWSRAIVWFVLSTLLIGLIGVIFFPSKDEPDVSDLEDAPESSEDDESEDDVAVEDTQRASGKVLRIASDIQDGNEMYYFVLDCLPKQVFAVDFIDANAHLFVTRDGDSVEIEYVQPSEPGFINATDFRNLDLS